MAELGETYLALGNLQRHESCSHDTHRDVRRILSEVDTFVTQHNLDHLRDVLRKGALLADDPSDLERVDGLTLEEKANLQEAPVPRKSRKLGTSIIFAAVHGILFGWKFFSLSFPFTIRTDGESLDFKFESFVDVLYICGALIGTCWAPVVNHVRGRRGAMLSASTAKVMAVMLAAVLFALPAFPGQFWTIRLLDFIAGVGDGVVTCTTPIYLAEICSSYRRSSLHLCWSAAIIVGYMFGVADNMNIEGFLFVQLVRPVRPFREPVRIMATLLVPIFLLFANESPRWNVAHGYMKQAYQDLRQLENSDIRAARELCQICSRVGQRRSSPSLNDTILRFAQLFTTPRLRRITLASVTVMVSGALGTSAMVCLYFLLTLILRPWIVFAVLITFPEFAFIPLVVFHVERRHQYLRNMVLLSLLLLLIGVSLLSLPASIPLLGKSLLVFLCYFAAGVSASGPSSYPFPYVVEIFPAQYRDVGMALSICVYLGSQIIIVRMGLLYIHKSFHVDVFLLFSISTAVCLLLVFLFIRESEHTFLEDVPLVFGPPIRMFHPFPKIIQFLNGFRRYFRRSHVRVPSVEDQVDTRPIESYTDDDATPITS